MTEEEFRKEMTELGWDSDYIDGVIEDQKEMVRAGLNPPPLEIYVDNPVIND